MIATSATLNAPVRRGPTPTFRNSATLSWDAQRRVHLSPRFFVDHPAWRCAPLATKLYLFLISKANRDPIDIDGEIVQRGEYRRSLRLLAHDLGAQDWRSLRRALLELVNVGSISLRRSAHQTGASDAATSNGVRDRKSQLIIVNDSRA
jgi:hypothetical protein